MSNWYDDRELIKELNNEQTPEPVHISLKDVVGSGYNDFWRCKTRYRVVKGSRASKKSTTTALNIITRMMRYPKANTLVIRKVYATLKDSCFSQLLWAIDQLGVGEYWEKTVSLRRIMRRVKRFTATSWGLPCRGNFIAQSVIPGKAIWR